MSLEIIASAAQIGSFACQVPKAAGGLTSSHPSPALLLQLSEGKLENSLGLLENFSSKLRRNDLDTYVRAYSLLKQDFIKHERKLGARKFPGNVLHYREDRKAAKVIWEKAERLEATIKRASEAAREKELAKIVAANALRSRSWSSFSDVPSTHEHPPPTLPQPALLPANRGQNPFDSIPE